MTHAVKGEESKYLLQCIFNRVPHSSLINAKSIFYLHHVYSIQLLLTSLYNCHFGNLVFLSNSFFKEFSKLFNFVKRYILYSNINRKCLKMNKYKTS